MNLGRIYLEEEASQLYTSEVTQRVRIIGDLGEGLLKTSWVLALINGMPKRNKDG